MCRSELIHPDFLCAFFMVTICGISSSHITIINFMHLNYGIFIECSIGSLKFMIYGYLGANVKLYTLQDIHSLRESGSYKVNTTNLFQL